MLDFISFILALHQKHPHFLSDILSFWLTAKTIISPNISSNNLFEACAAEVAIAKKEVFETSAPSFVVHFQV